MKVASRLIPIVAFATLAGAVALSAPGPMQSVAPLATDSTSSTGEAYRSQIETSHWPAHGGSWEQVFAAASR